MKKLFLTISFVMYLVIAHCWAQGNLCSFHVTNAPYVELTGDISLNDKLLVNDTNTFTITSFENEVFHFYGEPWIVKQGEVEISLFRYGRITVVKDTGFALFDGLYAPNFDPIDSTSKISYMVDGTGTQKILKVQWKNFKIRSGPADNFINVQIWLYQQSGVIDFRYGPRSANNASGYTSATKAPYIGIWYSNYDFSKIWEKMNLKGIPSNMIVDSARNMNVPYIQGVFNEGTVLRFVPKIGAGTTGIIEREEPGFKIQMLNGKSSFEITSSWLEGDVAMCLTDMSGKEIYRSAKPSMDHQVVFSTGDIPTGIYILRVENGNHSFRKKIALQGN
jgi:hypothetical protein